MTTYVQGPVLVLPLDVAAEAFEAVAEDPGLVRLVRERWPAAVLRWAEAGDLLRQCRQAGVERPERLTVTLPQRLAVLVWPRVRAWLGDRYGGRPPVSWHEPLRGWRVAEEAEREGFVGRVRGEHRRPPLGAPELTITPSTRREYRSVEQVAEAHGTTPQTVRRWCREGDWRVPGAEQPGGPGTPWLIPAPERQEGQAA